MPVHRRQDQNVPGRQILEDIGDALACHTEPRGRRATNEQGGRA